MTSLNVVSRTGHASQVESADDYSVMETIRAAGIDELLAICGGSCSCATCHVYVEESFAARLPAMSSTEDELLDSSDHRTPLSRLSCQIKVTPELSGMTVTIAPED